MTVAWLIAACRSRATIGRQPIYVVSPIARHADDSRDALLWSRGSEYPKRPTPGEDGFSAFCFTARLRHCGGDLVPNFTACLELRRKRWVRQANRARSNG